MQTSKQQSRATSTSIPPSGGHRGGKPRSKEGQSDVPQSHRPGSSPSRYRSNHNHIGPASLALLILTACGGIILGAHGYGRGSIAGTAVGILGQAGPHSSSAGPAGNSSSAGQATQAPAGSTKRSSGNSGGSGTSTTTTPAGTPSQKLGPSLSSTQYASAAYRVYPPPASSLASSAMAGFNVSVNPKGSNEVVSVSAAGSSSQPQVSTYPAGDKVYFIEASFGDDSGTTADYNFGDDGIIVTNSAGRIVE